MGNDLRTAGRILLRQPRFTLLVVLVLGLTIGATTTVFSVVSSVLFAPLPYADSGRLVSLWSAQQQGALRQRASYPDFQDWRAASRTLELVGHGNFETVLTGTVEPERLRAKLYVGDLFALLGVLPSLGFATADAAGTAVLSNALWQRRFGGDSSIVGKAITLDGSSYTVAAVMPEGFEFPIGVAARVDLWLPVERFNPALAGQRGARLIEVTGRLRDRATLVEAQAELDVIAANLSTQYPATNDGVGVRLVPALEDAVGIAYRGLLLFGAAVGALLLIGCCNVANLLLARVLAREKELATRAALGASPQRIARELLLESLLLAVIGGTLGTLLAIGSVDPLRMLLADVVPRAAEIRVDGSMLFMALALSIGTGVLFGVAPAASSMRLALGGALPHGAENGPRTVRGARSMALLVAGQMALTMVLLGGAGLFVHSFAKLAQPDPAFQPANVLTFELTWPSEKYPDPANAFGRLRQSLLEIPGVLAASTGVQLPQRGDVLLGDAAPFATIEGEPAPPTRPRVATLSVQPGFFRALGIPRSRGRDFTDDDRAGAARAVIVNQAFARAYLAGRDPLGRRVTLDSWTLRGESSAEIVGVVEDVGHQGSTLDVEPRVYLAFEQQPAWTAPMIVKTAGDPLALLPAIRGAVRAIDADQPIDDIATLEQRLEGSIAPDRFRALLLGGFAVLAVVLAAVGLFAVLSYTTARRMRELGIRMALGARAVNVTFAVIGEGLKPALIGMLVGGAVTAAGLPLVRPLLFGVGIADAAALVGAIAVMLAAAALACAIPARRAARADLTAVFRSE